MKCGNTKSNKANKLIEGLKLGTRKYNSKVLNEYEPEFCMFLTVYHKRVIAQVSLVFVRVFFIYIERGYLWEKFWGIEALRTSVEKFEVISKFFVIAEVKLADWWLLNMVGSETVLAGLKAK